MTTTQPLGTRLGFGLPWSLGLSLAACGPTISLDDPDPVTSTGTSTGASSGSAGPTDTGSTTGTPDLGPAPIPDVPPPPPAGACPETCVLDLPLEWSWDAPRRRPPAPGDPPIDVTTQSIGAMAVGLDGTVFVAEARGDSPAPAPLTSWVTRVDRDGTGLGSWSIDLGCNCQIVAMAPHASGNIAFNAEGALDPALPLAVTGVLRADTGPFRWLSYHSGFETSTLLAGAVMPMPSDFGEYTVALYTESYEFAFPATDLITMVIYDEFGSDITYTSIDDQMSFREVTRATGATGQDGTPVIAYRSSDPIASDGWAVWLGTDTWFPDAAAALSNPPDDVAIASDGEVVSIGAVSLARGQVLLQASRASRHLGLTWALSAGVASSTMDTPSLALDTATGDVVAATRVTDPDDGTIGVQLWRWSADGEPLWTTTLPLQAQPSPRHPVELAMIDGGMVLAMVIDDRLHVERRSASCQCGR